MNSSHGRNFPLVLDPKVQEDNLIDVCRVLLCLMQTKCCCDMQTKIKNVNDGFKSPTKSVSADGTNNYMYLSLSSCSQTATDNGAKISSYSLEYDQVRTVGFLLITGD